jgi:hypothetical protein
MIELDDTSFGMSNEGNMVFLTLSEKNMSGERRKSISFSFARHSSLRPAK